MRKKQFSHPPEHYAELRERMLRAGVKEKRFKILEVDIPAAIAALSKFTLRAEAAIEQVNEQIREEDRKRSGR